MWPWKFRAKPRDRKFVQTISLSAGDAGKRVEFANVIDWNTRESNLKATFPVDGFEPDGDLQLGHRHHRAAHRRAEEIRSTVASVDRPDGHERRVRRDHSDGLQKRIGQAERQHYSTDADSHAGNATADTRTRPLRIWDITNSFTGSPGMPPDGARLKPTGRHNV